MRNMIMAFAMLLIFSLAGCSKVPAGNVGILVDLYGNSKGVQTQELTPGSYYVGWNQELYLFPTYTQNYVWTASKDEGSPANEELGFQTVEGLAVKADVGISYHIDPDKVSKVFVKYRKGVDEITNTYLRNMVRDSLVKHASTMPVAAVYGAGKTKLIEDVQADVTAQVDNLGIKIEKVNWIGELRLPQVVSDSINSKIKATQAAQQAQNEVAQASAEADKAIQTARGVAASQLEVAKAEAQAIEIKGKALDANPKIIEYTYASRWNGVMPTVTSGAGVMMTMPVPQRTETK